MRIAAPEFGPAPLMLMRCGIGALTLLPVILWRGRLRGVVAMGHRALIVGLFNSAAPFVLFGVAVLFLPSGLMSVLNATAPFWSALIAYAWLREKLTSMQVAGLIVGFFGVSVLVAGGSRLPDVSTHDVLSGVAAALAATLCYGISASYVRRHLVDVHPLANALGSQLGATACLVVPGLWFWPAVMPGGRAWGATIVLGVLCTGLAYLLFFRLIQNLGAARAMTVTFAIPAFGMLWGWLFLDEPVTWPMLAGAAIIVLGSAMTSGRLNWLRCSA
jgi:drug/metabolite transporter (DMT)-like permease